MCVYIAITFCGKWIVHLPYNAMVMGWNLGWQATKRKAVYTGGEAQYVNVWKSVHWEGVYRVGECTVKVQIFIIDY